MTALRQGIDVFIDRELTPAARAERFALIARAGRDELIASGRAAPAYDTFVDGRQGAAEEEARSTILYRFRYLGDATFYALAFLIGRAPVRTGEFRASFFAGIDGRYVPALALQPQSVPETAEVIIGNLEPYDRKIDVQIAGSRRLRYSVPAHIYADAARAVRRRFGNVVLARRIWNVNFPGQYVLRTGPRKGSRVGSPGLVLRALSGE